MPVSDANPFFQEFEATFESHSVGMRIRKTHDIPVVHELVKTPEGNESPAALAGVPPAAVLIAVAGEHTLRLRYEEAIGRISGRGRPITLAFRQLHAAIDGRREARRYWQGYLRLKTGDSVWTGLFYVLREDGSFSSFPSKDIRGQTPVKVMRVGSDCTLIHGETLKQFLGGDAATVSASGGGLSGGGGGGSGGGGAGAAGSIEGGAGGGGAVGAGVGGAWWLECFAVLAPDGLQLFRAPSPSGRLDWVAAFAVVATVHQLGLWKSPPLPPPSPPSEVGAATGWAAAAKAAKSEAGGWGLGVGTIRGAGGGTNAKAKAKAEEKRETRGSWSEKVENAAESEAEEEEEEEEEEQGGEDLGGAWGETAAIGGRIAAAGGSGGDGAKVTAPPRSVMQGFLRKRVAGRLWGASEGWEYRWVVLRDDGRLLWYLSVPADSWEVPNGYLCLRGARVSSSEGVLFRNNLREDEVRGGDLCPFLVDVQDDGDSWASEESLQVQHQRRSQQQPQLRRRRGREQQGHEQRHQQPPRHQHPDPPPASPMQQQRGERRVVFLSAWGTEERAEWVDALSRYTETGINGRPLLPRPGVGVGIGREVKLRAEALRRKGLDRLFENPLEVLTRPYEAFALLVGSGGGGGVTRAEFCQSAGQHLLPMCDVYTAGTVFDALCPKRVDVPDNPGPASSAEGLEELLDLMGEGAEVRGVDGVRTGRVLAEALAGNGVGERLTFDVFRRYTVALSRGFRPSDGHPSWEDLRIRLGLHPLEALIMGEEVVLEAPLSSSSQLDDLMALAGWAGNLFLTDRHLLLHFPKRQQVRVVPLGSIQEVRGSSSRAGPFTVDDAIELYGCEVHTVPLGQVREMTAGKEAAATAAAAAAATAAVAAEATTTTAAATATAAAATDSAPAVSSSASPAARLNGVHPTGARDSDSSEAVPKAREGHDGSTGKKQRGRNNNGGVGASGGGGRGGGGGFGGDGTGGFGGGGRLRFGNEDGTATATGPAESKVYRLVLTKVKMQRLVSKAEECGGTRQEWLDCLREIVEAHKFSGRPPPPPPPSPKAQERQQRQKQGHDGDDTTYSPQFAATPAGFGTPPIRAERGGSGAHSRNRSGSGFSSGSFGGATSRYVTTASVRAREGVRSGLPRGREVRRLARKMGALMRDGSPSSSLEGFRVEEARLRLWVAANIMRSRALSRATRSGVRHLLFLTCDSIPNGGEIVRAFSESASTGPIDQSGGQGHGGRGPRGKHSGIGMGIGRGAGASWDDAGGGWRQQVRRRRRRRWLLNLARLMARPREYEVRRAAAVRAFTPQKFRQEWELFWELVDPILDGVEKATADLLEWKRPLYSLTVMSTLLLVAYHDLVRYAVPLALLSNVAYIFGTDYITAGVGGRGGPVGPSPSRASTTATTTTITTPTLSKRSVDGNGHPPRPSSSNEASGSAAGRRSRSLSPSRRPGAASSSWSSTAGAAAASADSQGTKNSVPRRGSAVDMPARGGGVSGNGSWDPKVAGELLAGDSVSGESAASRSGHSTGDEDAKPASARGDISLQRQHQQQQQQQEGGIISRVKGMQDRAGRTQAKLHSYNAVLLKVKSLHAWSDPGRTKVWVAAVSLLAAVLAIVPARFTFAALVVSLFTGPIRPKTKNVLELLAEDFWAGLPVESGTHTNVRMAAIYSRHDHL